MSIALVLAIIELIMKLPEIIQTIKDIIAKIHGKPLTQRGHLFAQLHDIVTSSAHGGANPKAELEHFAATL